MEFRFFLLFCLAISLAHCTSPYKKQLESRMNENRQLLQNLEEEVHSLVEVRNHIVIQGRALMPEELAFTEKVSDLESIFETAKQAINDFPKGKANAALVEKARELNNLLIETRRQVDSLKQRIRL